MSHFDIEFAVVGMKACLLGGCSVVSCLHEFRRHAVRLKNHLELMAPTSCNIHLIINT